MKLITIIIGICIILLVALIVTKLRKKPLEKEKIVAGQLEINRVLLEQYGFKIHDTKDKLYALHKNNVSLTYIKDGAWNIECVVGKFMSTSIVITMDEVMVFCDVNGKVISNANQN